MPCRNHGWAIWKSSIKALLLLFSPYLITKASSLYRFATRPAPPPQLPSSSFSGPPPHSGPRPTSAGALRAIVLLLTGAAAFNACLCLSALAPENVFVATGSRLQTPADVLFNRLAALRPGRVLTAADEALRVRFATPASSQGQVQGQVQGQEARLVYLHLGPDAVAGCTFCVLTEPYDFLGYALPGLLAPHLANLAIITAATSTLLVAGFGGGGARRKKQQENNTTTHVNSPASDAAALTSWRGLATMACLAAAALDLWMVARHDHRANAQARALAELDMFFWTQRRRRGALLTGVDLLLAAALWLTATGRAFVPTPAPAERVDRAVVALARSHNRLRAAGVLHGATARDETLSACAAAYRRREVALMAEVLAEPDVAESVRDAVDNGRVDMAALARDAEGWVRSVLPSPSPSAAEGVGLGGGNAEDQDGNR